MFALPVVLQSAEEMIVHPGETWFPPIVFGIIALVLLLVLALVAFSFRNMAGATPRTRRSTSMSPSVTRVIRLPKAPTRVRAPCPATKTHSSASRSAARRVSSVLHSGTKITSEPLA